MANLILNGSTSGSVTLSSPAVSGTTTLTLPTTSGTVITTASTFAGTGPAFSAYQSSAQSISNNTYTKVQFQTEEFDTNSNFDNATNYRFTPTVAGYYQVNGVVTIAATGTYFVAAAIYKNGAVFKAGGISLANASAFPSGTVSSLIYLNGSTDYIELYIFQFSGVSQNLQAALSTTYFQASLVRAA
jgi:hypothetical protein